jgi:hypothetical protein
MKKVYISATYNDLKEHRAAVAHALRKMNYEVHCMEDYVATDERTDDRCTQDVANCDFYVGILALRYGWIPPGSNISITEQEYRKARSQLEKTRCLMFLLDEQSADWPVRWIDAVQSPDSAAKLRQFRDSLEGMSVNTFTTLEQLVQSVMASVYMEDLKWWKTSLKQEFERTLDHCRVTPVGAPGDFASDAYKLELGSSVGNDIVETIQAAIRAANNARLVSLDLGQNGGWWSTRLHLLAGLLTRYSTVEKLVFFSKKKCLGTCSPADVWGYLATAKPEVEEAFSKSLPPPTALDAAAEIPMIVSNYSINLGDLLFPPPDGDRTKVEQAIKIQIEPHMLPQIPGFNPDRVSLPAGVDHVGNLPAILGKEYPFVPLEFPTETVVIDRVSLASRIAKLAVERV